LKQKEISMDLYLPDEFYALSEAPNARRATGTVRDDREWLGGEAFLVTPASTATRRTDPDPIWRVV
jgi:hypothetical protein